MELLPDNNVQSILKDKTIFINLHISSRKNTIRYFNDQVRELLMPTVTQLRERGFHVNDWYKIINAALYTNYLFTRNIQSVDPNIANASLGLACYFGSKINSSETEAIGALNNFTQNFMTS